MLFFQVMLLVGYGYAHLSTKLKLRTNVILHLALVAVAALQLPIIPHLSGSVQGLDSPQWQVMLLLLLTVGLPYLVLASSSPLLQVWFNRLYPQRSPYPLYALSNLGSMGALLSFPFVFEPNGSRVLLAQGWSAGFLLFGGLTLACALLLIWRAKGKREGALHVKPQSTVAPPPATPLATTQLLWLGLSAVPVILLLSFTNLLSQDMAAVPFIWVLPMSIYLLTFIIAFSGVGTGYLRWLRFLLLPVVTAVLWFKLIGPDISILLQIAVYCVSLFALCLLSHGELAFFKPHESYLTRFYLLVSLGGALGGVFVALVAPLIFNGLHEVYVGLAAVLLLSMVSAAVMNNGALRLGMPKLEYAVQVGILLYLIVPLLSFDQDTALHRSRNFYGTLVVEREAVGTADEKKRLVHGAITHGDQYVQPHKRAYAGTYYAPSSGVGRVLSQVTGERAAHVGLIGLGVGTLTVYGNGDDRFRLYEINPDVVDIALQHFTYLADQPNRIDIVVGDGRLSLAQEAANGFDVLVLDAFSGDAIPVHLLTAEAFDEYRRHLAEDGSILIHISNRFLDLEPVITALARDNQLQVLTLADQGDADDRYYSSDWVLVSNNRDLLTSDQIQSVAVVPASVPIRPWTDDYTSLFSVLK
ncbi:MAG: fused MFS/spermidine synthase [Pseudomonadota bacterium]|nr:fused MFS/spermidine synthase [Pseudomonadota bacterium]